MPLYAASELYVCTPLGDVLQLTLSNGRWLREQNFPWRAAYSSLYLYSEMCASRGPNQLEWTVDRNGDIKPQWTEHKYAACAQSIAA